jgi:hypothetical protein
MNSLNPNILEIDYYLARKTISEGRDCNSMDDENREDIQSQMEKFYLFPI